MVPTRMGWGGVAGGEDKERGSTPCPIDILSPQHKGSKQSKVDPKLIAWRWRACKLVPLSTLRLFSLQFNVTLRDWS